MSADAAGRLLGHRPNILDLVRQSASYVDRVLMRARLADLPIRRLAVLKLDVKTRPMMAVGLTISPSLLRRADQVID